MTDTHKVLSVGIIAFGLSGRVFHAPFLIAHPSFNLVALYERGSKHLGAEYCESQGYVTRSGARVQTLRSVEELCSLDDIDLIVVCRYKKCFCLVERILTSSIIIIVQLNFIMSMQK